MEPELNTLGGGCNECNNLEKEVERLRKENNWLREGLLNILKIGRKALEGDGD